AICSSFGDFDVGACSAFRGTRRVRNNDSRLEQIQSHLIPKKTKILQGIPAQGSRRTSRGVPVRDGRKLWCHSSRLATSAVPSTATLAQRKVHLGFPRTGKVSLHARKRRMLRKP